MEKDQLLKRLVENAIDFLAKSVLEFDNHSKYSMINFSSAVELFVKARLMAEHWSLVVAKRQEPNLGKFLEGNFQSVTLKDAADRLKNVVQSGLSDKEFETFNNVAKHRNKSVHFFHEAHVVEKNKKQKQDIAKTQLTAWYFLHKLITEKWFEIFKPWSVEITEIDKSLRKIHEFLAVVFENKKEDIERQKKNNFLFKECPACKFLSQKHNNEEKTVYQSECLVCGLTERAIHIECTECESIVFFAEEGWSDCNGCKKNFEPIDLADVLIDAGGAHVAAMDGDASNFSGNCHHCDGYHTAVLTEQGRYICTSCFEEFESIEYCGYCGDGNTGDMEDSHWAGCNHCEGSAGKYKDF